jgi:FixJ family two-component response regulator
MDLVAAATKAHPAINKVSAIARGTSGGSLHCSAIGALSIALRRASLSLARDGSAGETRIAPASAEMAEPAPTVIVIDDDPSIRESIGGLLRSVGLYVKLLASVDEFRKAGRPEGPTCLVLDVRLPGRSGLDLQRELATADVRLPIVFVTGHGDIPMSVQAMKGGAVEFLTKPFRDQDLLDAVRLGLARDRARLEEERALAALRARFATLTAREREVMALVVTGRLNKQIAGDLGISEITVKVHRGQGMRKMHATSLADLARMADRLKLTPGRS